MTAVALPLRPGIARRLAIAAALVALLLAAQAFPAAVRTAFCAPSAWLSAQLLGAPLLAADDGFRIDTQDLPVDVTLACSGTTFFAMLLALLLAISPAQAAHGRTRRLANLAAAAALAYGLTLAANTGRIVLGWYAALWAERAFPPAFHAGIHLAVGIVVFSSAMVAGVLILNVLQRPTPQQPARTAGCEPDVPINRSPRPLLQDTRP